MDLATPYYEIDMKELNDNYQKLVIALKNNWNNYIVGYSYKTNSIPWIAQFFYNKGCYAEVVSSDEYELSQLLGIEKEKCIYNGPIKTKETFLEALEHHSIVNIDTQREIEWLEELSKTRDYHIGIRVNFDIESNCPGQSACGSEGGRFGFCYENGELEKAIQKILRKGFCISGLHLHVSSKTRGLDIYSEITKKACEIARKYSLDLDYIDVGGGFFGGLENKPQFDDYLKLMKNNLLDYFEPEKTKLIIEPGMALIGSPVKYVTTVIDVKDTSYNRFVITDGSRTNIDPLMKKTQYFYHIKGNMSGRKKMFKQVISGFTCMENDRLMTIYDTEELLPGDRIVYEKVGAYTMCLTPLFICYFPDVYIRNGENIELIRKKWSSVQYIQNNYVNGEEL